MPYAILNAILPCRIRHSDLRRSLRLGSCIVLAQYRVVGRGRGRIGVVFAEGWCDNGWRWHSFGRLLTLSQAVLMVLHRNAVLRCLGQQAPDGFISVNAAHGARLPVKIVVWEAPRPQPPQLRCAAMPECQADWASPIAWSAALCF